MIIMKILLCIVRKFVLNILRVPNGPFKLC